VIERVAGGILREADSGGRVCLGVAVDEKCRLFGGREARGQVDGGRCLAYSAFLIRHRDNSVQKSPVIET
jgi:hypothetical protein